MTTVIPELFWERLGLIVGAGRLPAIKRTFQARPTTFRANSLKSSRAAIQTALAPAGLKTTPVPWYADAFILRHGSKRELMALAEYERGQFYIQSLASMIPALVLDPQPGEKVLDLTAAPGSKTSQIAALMQRQGKLVANDNNKVRFFKLKHNLELLGVADDKSFLQLRLEDGGQLCREYPRFFDRVLLDAPCSAEARFVENDPRSMGYWKPRKIKEMANKQRRLLLAAWYALKPGGMLVYSTCTFAPEENELQIARLLQKMPDASVEAWALPGLATLPGLTTWKEKTLPKDLSNTARILPTADSEGFFVAKLVKKLL